MFARLFAFFSANFKYKNSINEDLTTNNKQNVPFKGAIYKI